MCHAKRSLADFRGKVSSKNDSAIWFLIQNNSTAFPQDRGIQTSHDQDSFLLNHPHDTPMQCITSPRIMLLCWNCHRSQRDGWRQTHPPWTSGATGRCLWDEGPWGPHTRSTRGLGGPYGAPSRAGWREQGRGGGWWLKQPLKDGPSFRKLVTAGSPMK